MRAEEVNQEYIEDAILKKHENDIPENHLGRTGWRVFKPFNLLLDCDHSMMIICDSLTTLQEQGYPVDSFIQALILEIKKSIFLNFLKSPLFSPRLMMPSKNTESAKIKLFFIN
jgi:hypothetical protein